MSFKSILIKSAVIAASIAGFTANANAKLQYNGGLGWGIGLFKFNENKEDSTFQGNVAAVNIGSVPGAYPAGNAQLRTTYKYVGNQPPRIPSLDFGFNNSMEHITYGDRSFFYGVNAAIGWSKIYNSTGLTNPNAKYMNTGSTGLYGSINSKFGLENSYSKILGIVGLTYARTDVPFDILPFGSDISELATCVVLKPGSALESSAMWSTFQGLAHLANAACNAIKTDDVTFNTYFINLGASVETKLTEKVNFFVEYTYLVQLFKNQTHTIGYTSGGTRGEFKGKIVTNDTQFIRAGVRYYFQ